MRSQICYILVSFVIISTFCCAQYVTLLFLLLYLGWLIQTQLRLEAFYTFNERFAKIRSKRIEKAVKGITGSKSSAATDETSQKSTKRGKKRKTKPQEDEGNQLEADSTAVDGVATSNQDNTSNKPSSEPLKKGETRKKNSRRVTGKSSGRGRGRGQRSGRRGKKAVTTAASYDVDTSSENDEEMQFQTSEEAPQLRRVCHLCFVCVCVCVYYLALVLFKILNLLS